MNKSIDFYRTLSRIFSNNVFKAVADDGQSDYLVNSVRKYEPLLIDRPDEPALQVIRKAYRYLSTNYRNEYYYKNTIANKLLLAKHNLNTTTLLSEFRVAGSIADLVMLNGTSTVYEIKTELDSPEKLGKQIADYQKAFAKVNLVTHHSLVGKYEKLIASSPVGLFCIGPRGKLSECKPARTYTAHLNTEVIFRCLRKKEYVNIVAALCGAIPGVPDTRFFRACLDAVRHESVQKVHDLMVQQLKKRSVTHKSFFKSEQLPTELMHICLCLNPTPRAFDNLIHFLNNPVNSCISPIYDVNNSSCSRSGN